MSLARPPAAIFVHGFYDFVLFLLATLGAAPDTASDTGEHDTGLAEDDSAAMMYVMLPVGWLYLALPCCWIRRRLDGMGPQMGHLCRLWGQDGIAPAPRGAPVGGALLLCQPAATELEQLSEPRSLSLLTVGNPV